MFRPVLLAAAFLALLTLPASAATFEFNNVTFQDGATLDGFIRVNTDTGQLQNVFATFYRAGTEYDVNRIDFFSVGTNRAGDPLTAFGVIGRDTGAELWIALPASFVGFTGASLCSLPDGCNPLFSSFNVANATEHFEDYVVGGSIGATPEPSSMVLAASGLLSGLGMQFRRRRTVA